MIDVVVVGAGPAGLACAIGAATAGARVTVIERDRLPHRRPCAGLINVTGAAELSTLGVSTADAHRLGGIRLVDGEHRIRRAFPDGGQVIDRSILDERLAGAAVDAGVTIVDGIEVLRPIVERGLVRGVLTDRDTDAEIAADVVVAADGATSTFGRSLGTVRDPSWPSLLTIIGRWESAQSHRSTLDIRLDLRRMSGDLLPGHAWVVPAGDGTVSVGVSVLSTARDADSVNTTKVLEAVVDSARTDWELGGEPLSPLRGVRLPVGLSVTPAGGPSWLVVGDAAAAASPFAGLGIDRALLSGRLAAEAIAGVIDTGSFAVLQNHAPSLQAASEPYFRVGRLFTGFAGTRAGHALVRAAARNGFLAEALCQFGTGSFRPGSISALRNVAERMSWFAPRA